MSKDKPFERGSEWRQWDLHIHSPASFHWNGAKFNSNSNPNVNRALVDQMIEALNTAKPDVFALMDYWTFDGWFALNRRLNEAGAPKLTKMVFPGIELRLMAPMNARLNAHVLFSNEVADQDLINFKSALKVEIINQPLSDHCLITLARNSPEDILKKRGFTKAEVTSDILKALMAGSIIAEINCDSYKSAIAKVPNGHAIGFMPFDTSDGLAEIKWNEHVAFVLGLFKTSPIFESRNHDLCAAFVGNKTSGNQKYFDHFQESLGNISRLAVSGSDAHCFSGANGDNNNRGYGDFPSGKATWIKADTTFNGLLQAIREPAKRSFIGALPSKLLEIRENKTFFIDSIEIARQPKAETKELWLDGTKLSLNYDLVAIIGNKGSGKSALADVIALLGNSLQKDHFSFLKNNRFRNKNGEPAKSFVATLKWLDENSEQRNLNDDPPTGKPELVRYIPQGYFEKLCNDHLSEQPDAFEKELRNVIFSHTNHSVRQGAHDFEQFLEVQEKGFRDQLEESRNNLKKLNQEIVIFEEQMNPAVRTNLDGQLVQKQRQIDEHNKITPVRLQPPDNQQTPEQRDIILSLNDITEKIKKCDATSLEHNENNIILAGKLRTVQYVREKLRSLERSYKQFCDDTLSELNTLGLDPAAVVTLNTRATSSLPSVT